MHVEAIMPMIVLRTLCVVVMMLGFSMLVMVMPVPYATFPGREQPQTICFR